MDWVLSWAGAAGATGAAGAGAGVGPPSGWAWAGAGSAANRRHTSVAVRQHRAIPANRDRARAAESFIVKSLTRKGNRGPRGPGIGELAHAASARRVNDG